MKETRKGIKHFIMAFQYSMSGIRFALQEVAVRQELLLGGIGIVIVSLLRISLESIAMLFALWSVTFITELLNTAIEAVVDLKTSEYNELAKKAKDLGSAAVFWALILYMSGLVFCIVRAIV